MIRAQCSSFLIHYDTCELVVMPMAGEIFTCLRVDREETSGSKK